MISRSVLPLALATILPFLFADKTAASDNPSEITCFPASVAPRAQRLIVLDCWTALLNFQRDLPLGVNPILTRDQDKAHLPNYVFAPAGYFHNDCKFGMDLARAGSDVTIDADDLIPRAIALTENCMDEPGVDGGRCTVRTEGAVNWIVISFQHRRQRPRSSDAIIMKTLMPSKNPSATLATPLLSGTFESTLAAS